MAFDNKQNRKPKDLSILVEISELQMPLPSFGSIEKVLKKKFQIAIFTGTIIILVSWLLLATTESKRPNKTNQVKLHKSNEINTIKQTKSTKINTKQVKVAEISKKNKKIPPKIPDFRQKKEPPGRLKRITVAALIQTLSHRNYHIRKKVIVELGQRQNKAQKAIPELIKLLVDKDKSIRTTAHKTLKQIDPKWQKSTYAKDAVSYLIKALSRKNKHTRWPFERNKHIKWSAIIALEEIDPNWGKYARERKTVLALIEILADENADQNVTKSVMKAVQYIGTLPLLITALYHSDNDIREGAIEKLIIIGSNSKQVTPLLIKVLSADYIYVRESAIKVLKAIEPNWKKKYKDKIISPLVKALSSYDRNIRESAMKTLGRMGPVAKQAVPQLLKSFSKNSSFLVIEALDKIEPGWKEKYKEKIVPSLIKNLSKDLKKTTIELLDLVDPEWKKKYKKKILPILIVALRSHSTDTIEIATKTLGQMGPSAKKATFSLIRNISQGPLKVTRLSITALNKIQQSNWKRKYKHALLSSLVKALSSDVAASRKSAIQILGEMGPTAKHIVPLLIKNFSTDSSILVMEAIAKIEPNWHKKYKEKIISALIKAFHSPSSDIEISAIQVLGQLGPIAKPAIPSIMLNIGTSSPKVIRLSIQALDKIESNWKKEYKEKTILTCETLNTKNAVQVLKNIKQQALLPLKEILDRNIKTGGKILILNPEIKQATPYLIKALTNENASIRKSATIVLGKIGSNAKQAIPLLIKNFSTDLYRSSIIEALGDIGIHSQNVTSLLTKTLTSHKPYLRACAAKALGKINPKAKKAIPLLIKALYDNSIYVRKSAIEALGNIGSQAQQATPHLIKSLSDSSLEIIRLSMQAVVKIEPDWDKKYKDKFILSLLKILSSEMPTVKMVNGDISDTRNALQTLRNIGVKVVPSLTKALFNNDVSIRINAARLLGDIGPKAKPAIPFLIGATTDKNSYVRTYAIQTLGKLKARRAIPAFKKALFDQAGSVKCSAAKSLGSIGPQARRAIPALIKSLTDKNRYVRSSAIEALDKIEPGWRFKYKHKISKK